MWSRSYVVQILCASVARSPGLCRSKGQQGSADSVSNTRRRPRNQAADATASLSQGREEATSLAGGSEERRGAAGGLASNTPAAWFRVWVFEL